MRTTLLAAALCLAVTPAFAHAFLDTATPKVGSTITVAPTDISIDYTQGIEAAFSKIELAGPDGPVPLGAPTVDPAQPQRLIATVKAPLAPGHYEVRWSVISVDTHHTDGHYPFDYQP
jgi:methionine-rich copper-binding protein CopC